MGVSVRFNVLTMRRNGLRRFQAILPSVSKRSYANNLPQKTDVKFIAPRASMAKSAGVAWCGSRYQ